MIKVGGAASTIHIVTPATTMLLMLLLLFQLPFQEHQERAAVARHGIMSGSLPVLKSQEAE